MPDTKPKSGRKSHRNPAESICHGAYQNKTCKNRAQIFNHKAEYLFSALPIKDADEIGLKLLREEPFVTDTSYIEVYLYQIQ